MKRILIDEENLVVDIAVEGNGFECVDTWTWVDCVSEDVQISDRYKVDTKEAFSEGLEEARTPEGKRARFEKARTVAYGEIGEQLGMLYDDLKNGTTNWVDKIDQIKLDIPKVEKPVDALVATDYIPPVEI